MDGILFAYCLSSVQKEKEEPFSAEEKPGASSYWSETSDAARFFQGNY